MAYPTEIKQNPLKQWFFIGLLAIWLVLLAGGIIWFQKSYVRPFLQQQDINLLKMDSVQNLYNEVQNRLQLPAGAKIISFWQPGCMCNQFSQRHAINLLENLKQNPIPHYTLLTSAVSPAELASFRQLNPGSEVIDASASGLQFPPAPSLLMADNLGQVTYFGPYGFGAFCSQDDANALNRQIGATLHNQAQPFLNVVGQGCFCRSDIAKPLP